MALLYSFFHYSSHDFYISTVLTIIATPITTTATYFPLHLDSTSKRFVLNSVVNGVINWSLLIWGIYLISFAGFPFPYFPFFQIVDMPVLRGSTVALEIDSSARR